MSFEATDLTRKLGSSNVFRPGELHVMLLLADHANEEWACWPSLERLAMDSCMGDRTIRRHLRALEEHGVLVCDALYDSRTGERIGNQFRLVEAAMERLAQTGEKRRVELKARLKRRREKIRHSKTVAIETGLNAESAPSANLAAGSIPVITGPAKMADGENPVNESDENPLIPGPANLADGGSASAKLANPASNLAKNTELPLKERARINHHHQSSDARKLEPVATPVTDDEKTTDSISDIPVSVAAEIYQGVDLSALHHMVPELIKTLSVKQIRSVIDIVFARATSKVGSPLRYVAAACRQDAESLYGAVTGLSSVTGPVATVSSGFASEDASMAHEPGVIAECDLHDWSSANPDAVCPGCSSNYLSGESHLNPRPGKPQRGWFRTNILVNDEAELEDTAEVALPWGPDDEPSF